MTVLILIAQVYLGVYFLYNGIVGHFMHREMIIGSGACGEFPPPKSPFRLQA